MNVVHLVTLFHPHTGGIASMVGSLARGLVAAGDRCTIVTRRTGSLERRAEVDGVAVRRVGGEWGGRQVERLRFLTAGHGVLAGEPDRIDLLHAHSLYTPALLAAFRPEPAVATVHTVGPAGNLADLARSRLGRRRIAWLRRRLARVIALTGSMARELEAAGFDADRIEVIPNGVDPSFFHRPDPDRRLSAKRGLGVEEDAPVVGFLGRLAPEKGVDILLEAWPAIANRIPGAMLVVAGSREPGNEEADYPWGETGPPPVRGRAPDRKGPDQKGPARHGALRWWPDPDDTRDLIHAADVMVVPSRTEAFGLVAVEAMASGVPVVASRIGGLPEVVGDAAVLVPPEDPEALARAVSDLLEDPSRRQELAAAGRRRVLEHFTLDHVVARHRELYAGVVR